MHLYQHTHRHTQITGHTEGEREREQERGSMIYRGSSDGRAQIERSHGNPGKAHKAQEQQEEGAAPLWAWQPNKSSLPPSHHPTITLPHLPPPSLYLFCCFMAVISRSLIVCVCVCLRACVCVCVPLILNEFQICIFTSYG